MKTNVAEPWESGMGYRAVGLVAILMVVVSFWVLLEKMRYFSDWTTPCRKFGNPHEVA